ncbi:MAG: AbrB/MazE/SpoVT family DNA-binding domain-containing protein [Bacilli bacterium]|nr:AbrB/MazE/SpoVT family DNA-binding domain-containing protein [Bacilli bacterium]
MAIRKLDQNIKMDNLGRVVIPKKLRIKYNLEKNSPIALYEYIEENGTSYLMLGQNRDVTAEELLIAANVLDDLGLEIPNELLEIMGD